MSQPRINLSKVILLLLFSACQAWFTKPLSFGDNSWDANCGFILLDSEYCPSNVLGLHACHRWGVYQQDNICRGGDADFPSYGNCGEGKTVFRFICEEPTMEPTMEPTAELTMVPSAAPTQTATIMPSNAPVTSMPTALSTRMPTPLAQHFNHLDYPTASPTQQTQVIFVKSGEAKTHTETHTSTMLAGVGFVGGIIIALIVYCCKRSKKDKADLAVFPDGLPNTHPPTIRCNSETYCDCEEGERSVTAIDDCRIPIADVKFEVESSSALMYPYGAEPTMTDLYFPGSPPAISMSAEGWETIQKIEANVPKEYSPRPRHSGKRTPESGEGEGAGTMPSRFPQVVSENFNHFE